MAEQLGATVVINGAKEDTIAAVSNLPKTWAQILFLKQRVLGHR